MKKKFEAVSGDQSLFDVVGASDDELFLVVGVDNKIFPKKTNHLSRHVIAERRPVTKYIPKSGDVFALIDQMVDHGELLCLKSNDKGVAFEYLEGEKGYFDGVSTSAEFLFIRSQPVEKYVPKVGDYIVLKKKDGKPCAMVELVESIDNNTMRTKKICRSGEVTHYLLSFELDFIKVG